MNKVVLLLSNLYIDFVCGRVRTLEDIDAIEERSRKCFISLRE